MVVSDHRSTVPHQKPVLTGHRLDIRVRLRSEGTECEVTGVVYADNCGAVANLVDLRTRMLSSMIVNLAGRDCSETYVVRSTENRYALSAVLDRVACLPDFV